MGAPIFGVIVGGLTKIGTYAGVVSGLGVVAKAANAISSGSDAAPVVSGLTRGVMTVIDPLDLSDFRSTVVSGDDDEDEDEVSGVADIASSILDPFDLTGYRANTAKKQMEAARRGDVKKIQKLQKKLNAKERQIELEKVKAEAAAELEKLRAKSKKEAEKAEAKTQKALKEQKRQIELAKAAQKANARRLSMLTNQGKRQAAATEAAKLEASKKYEELSKQMAAAAEAAKKEGESDKSSNLAAAALELAKLSISTPPTSAVAVASQATEAGKSFIASIIDAVNRGEPVPAAAVQNAAYSDDFEIDEDAQDLIDAEMAETSGCSACARGGTCEKKTSLYADDVIDGLDDYEDAVSGFIFSSNVGGFSFDDEEVGGDDDDEIGAASYDYDDDDEDNDYNLTSGGGCGCG